MIFLFLLTLLSMPIGLQGKPSVIVINSFTFQITPIASAQGALLYKENGALKIEDFINPAYSNFDAEITEQIANGTLTTVDISTVTGPVYEFTNKVVTVPSNFTAPLRELKLNNSVLQITNQCVFTSITPGLFVAKVTLKKMTGRTYGTVLGRVNFENPNVLRPALNHPGTACVGLAVIIQLNLNPTVNQAVFSQLTATFPNGTFIKRLAQGYISWNDAIICTKGLNLSGTRFSVDDIDSEFTSAATDIDAAANVAPTS